MGGPKQVFFRVLVEDELCTGCGLCSERAPDNLDLCLDEGVAYVVKQPSDAAELDACAEAVEYCPSGGLQSLESAEPAPQDEEIA